MGKGLLLLLLLHLLHDGSLHTALWTEPSHFAPRASLQLTSAGTGEARMEGCQIAAATSGVTPQYLSAARAVAHLRKRWRLLVLLQSCIVLLHMRLHGRLLRQGRLNRCHQLLIVLLHGRGLRLLLLLRWRGRIAVCQCCGWLLSLA